MPARFGDGDDKIAFFGWTDSCAGGGLRRVRAASGATAGVEAAGRGGSGQAANANAADGGRDIQLQRAGISGSRDFAVRHGHSREKRFSRGARRGGSPDGVGRDVWERKTGNRVHYGY